MTLLDDERMNRADAEYWYSARTLSGLGELTAQWLEGTIGSQPGYQPNCGPDEETAALVPTLAAVNRAGFVTHGSQPGEGPVTGCDGWAWWQRAAVDGFADDVMVERLSAATAGTDLCLFVGSARRWRYDYSDAQPVTIRIDPASDVELVHTQFGVLIPRRRISFQYDDCHRDVIRVLQQSWQVTIIDPQWGRNDVLWPALDTVTAQAHNWRAR